jgi:hypothetical protein
MIQNITRDKITDCNYNDHDNGNDNGNDKNNDHDNDNA